MKKFWWILEKYYVTIQIGLNWLKTVSSGCYFVYTVITHSGLLTLEM
jgi:hypothetical protein